MKLRFFSLILCALLGLTSCENRRLRKANVDQVERGMAKKQVESILGPPTNFETKDLLGLKKTTYVYIQGKDSVTVTFRDDKVESKESTLND